MSLLNRDEVTVADLAAWDALPEETRRLASKALLGHAHAQPLAGSIKDAYIAGWEDCRDATEIVQDERAEDSYKRWAADQAEVRA